MNQVYGQAAGQMIGGYGVAQTGSSYPQETAPTRQLEVPGSMERLDRKLVGLGDLVSALDNRLTGYIARPYGPEEAGTAIRGASSTGLGGQLESAGDTVDVIVSRLQGLMDRLEA